MEKPRNTTQMDDNDNTSKEGCHATHPCNMFHLDYNHLLIRQHKNTLRNNKKEEPSSIKSPFCHYRTSHCCRKGKHLFSINHEDRIFLFFLLLLLLSKVLQESFYFYFFSSIDQVNYKYHSHQPRTNHYIIFLWAS